MLDSSTVINPLREGLPMARAPQPCTVIIFGVTGDLAHRKLLPALYNLSRDRYLPANFSIVGVGRRPNTDEQLREDFRKSLDKFSRSGNVQPAVWSSFAQGISYVQMQFDDATGYQRLKEKLDEIDRTRGTLANRLFYLSTPPELYELITAHLGAADLCNSTGWTRIIIEKPFGHTLASAHTLDENLHKVFREAQIYRIDHYLGKETVQNVYVFRFANVLFEPIWNRRYIDHVQITVAEAIGIEGRGEYYDHAGALRDIMQNHMLQLVALVAMEPPALFEPNAVRDEKAKVLRAMPPLRPEQIATNTVRGQYLAGVVEGQHVPAYRDEPEVKPDSQTETFAALRLEIENWRWAGVPFYVRTGKHLPKRVTEIAIQFKLPPLLLFGNRDAVSIEPNMLTINVQPDEGISVRFESKIPGQDNRLRPVDMDFRYGTSFSVPAPEAYERLLLDAMIGDPMLFTRRDEVEAQWQFIQPILDAWENGASPSGYEAGTWGPASADEFMKREGRKWRRL